MNRPATMALHYHRFGKMSNLLGFFRWDRLPGSTTLITVGLAIALIVTSWLKLHSSRSGLIYRDVSVDQTPMVFVVSRDATNVPGVLVAHGYCGSKQLMYGYADTLAHNGYGVLLWDLPGHGANSHPFEYEDLQNSFELPFSTLKAQLEVDPSQLATVGHSMGSGIAMEGAIAHHAEVDAVVAISPTGASVTPDTPKNLSLQLGEWETFLAANASRLLADSGGVNHDLAQGRGRSLTQIKRAEHATILFKDQSHQATLGWLNQTFGLSRDSAFRDRTMAWYGLHLIGWILLLGVLLPVPQAASRFALDPKPRWRLIGGLMLASVVSAVPLKLLALRYSVENFGGLMIGGALGLWFLLTGILWLLGWWLLSLRNSPYPTFPTPQIQDLKTGLVGFGCLWLGFGAMAQVTWLPWFLTGPRLGLWCLIAIACMPWMLMFHLTLQQVNVWQRIGWWCLHSVSVIGGLVLAIMAVPNLGFLAIMLPVFPLLMGLFSYVEMRSCSVWGATLATALSLSWLMVVPFPLV